MRASTAIAPDTLGVAALTPEPLTSSPLRRPLPTSERFAHVIDLEGLMIADDQFRQSAQRLAWSGALSVSTGLSVAGRVVGGAIKTGPARCGTEQWVTLGGSGTQKERAPKRPFLCRKGPAARPVRKLERSEAVAPLAVLDGVETFGFGFLGDAQADDHDRRSCRR